jgi:prepilin-type N-terminal cleavage/methylation domain-containing protein
MNRAKGFTLIELLIVVAIIAILAAIAVPNFLEAQVRAKVSRNKSDMRSLTTAIEAYYIDWNRPPLQSGNPAAVGPEGEMGQINVLPGGGSGTLTHVLSTPTAYITTAYLTDVFAGNDVSIPIDERLFTYHAYNWQSFGGVNFGETPEHFQTGYAAYRLGSIGPDRNYFQTDMPPFLSPFINYDPTNGTISLGNIWRSQKYGFDTPAEWEDPTYSGD